MKKVEKLLPILILSSIALQALNIQGSGVVLVIVLSLAAMLYAYLGFAIFNQIGLRQIFRKKSYESINAMRILGAITVGFTLSMILIGLLFKIMLWPGSGPMLIASTIPFMIIMIVSLIRYSRDQSSYYTFILKRLGIFGALALFFYLLPSEKWIAFRYKEYPNYVEAYKKAAANPHDLILRDKAEEERKKMYSKTD